MGGKALRDICEVVRLEPIEFAARLEGFTALASKYSNEFPDHVFMFGFPIPLFGKQDYGDLDVIYTSRQNEKTIAWFKEQFQSKGAKKNGNVNSIEWDKFQVDLIFVQPEVFDWALNWYSHGDHAAVQGRVYRYYGFKYGWDGLYYSYGTKSYHKDLLVTRDWKEGNFILGYKPLSYFDSYNEAQIFAHTVSSIYVFKGIFDELKMDRPRPSQVKFYEWIKIAQLSHDVTRPRETGLKLLRDYDIGLYLQVLWDLATMHVKEFFRPLRRGIRKTWHKYVKPWLFKIQGRL